MGLRLIIANGRRRRPAWFGQQLADVFDARWWERLFSPGLRGQQMRPAGFLLRPLDPELSLHRCFAALINTYCNVELASRQEGDIRDYTLQRRGHKDRRRFFVERIRPEKGTEGHKEHKGQKKFLMLNGEY